MTDQIDVEPPGVAAKKPPAQTRTDGESPPTPPVPEPARGESTVTRLMRKGSGEVDALLEALGMRAQLSSEGKDLERLVERRLAQVNWGTHAQALDQLDIQRSFLEHRFVRPIKRFERDGRGFSVLDNFLNLVSILAGVASSLTAALNGSRVWAICLGLLVGALQGISQWLKPARRATRRSMAASEMRNEMWAFLQERGRYRSKDPRVAWKLLCDQVERVEDRESAGEDRDAAAVHAAYGLPTSTTSG